MTNDLCRVVELFARAWRRLRRPRIFLDVPEVEDLEIHIAVALDKSSKPGTISVHEVELDSKSGLGTWFGRIYPSGEWHPSEDPDSDAVFKRLQQLGQDPSRVIGSYGRRLGRCPCCNKPLTETSLKVGYHEVCAVSFGLVWVYPTNIDGGISGLQVRAMREQMGMTYAQFGKKVLMSKGNKSSGERWAKRIEEQAVLSEDAEEKIVSYYQRWLAEGATITWKKDRPRRSHASRGL